MSHPQKKTQQKRSDEDIQQQTTESKANKSERVGPCQIDTSIAESTMASNVSNLDEQQYYVNDLIPEGEIKTNALPQQGTMTAEDLASRFLPDTDTTTAGRTTIKNQRIRNANSHGESSTVDFRGYQPKNHPFYSSNNTDRL